MSEYESQSIIAACMICKELNSSPFRKPLQMMTYNNTVANMMPFSVQADCDDWVDSPVADQGTQHKLC